MRDDDLESRVLAFERDWRLLGPRRVVDYLDGLPAAARPGTLIELICVDLEFRWRSPGSARPPVLEDYVEQSPEMGPVDHLPLELIGEEYRVRCRWGERPSHGEFLARFPGRPVEVRATLAGVDVEMEEESAVFRLTPRPTAPPAPHEEEAVPGPDVPWLSHHEFLLKRLIGAGRMGKVYEARRHAAGRDVAVKYLRKTFLDRPEVVRRFLGEARTVARLRHPNIVGTEGVGLTPGGAYFLVMDLVDGPDLARIVGRRVVGVDEAVRWAMETCAALEHAHERGVVHCDLKPANILLDGARRIRVTDFGLARSTGGDTRWAAEVEGTAPFMAPEQAARCWGPIDHRTDVYGLGAVLFTLLTGRAPFVGRRLPDVLAGVISARPVDSPANLRHDLPGPLSDVCRRCLSKPPVERYQTAREVRSALEGWRRTTGPGA